MIKEIRGYPLLTGARGRPSADIDALVEAIEILGALAMDLQHVVSEIDLNPVIVYPNGGGIKAADALIKLRRAPAR